MITPPRASRQRQRQRRLAAGGRPCDKHRACCSPAANSRHVSRRHADLQSRQPRARLDDRRRRARHSSRAPVRRTGCSATSPSTFPSPHRRHRRHRRPPARGARRPADRHRGAASDRPAQEAFSGRHGFHHDRPGMHRRTGGFRRPEGACRRHHRARHARRDRIRAGAARARGAAEGPAGRRGRRGAGEAHHADAGRPRTGGDHARARRLYLPGLRRLHAVHQRASPR